MVKVTGPEKCICVFCLGSSGLTSFWYACISSEYLGIKIMRSRSRSCKHNKIKIHAGGLPSTERQSC